MRTLTVSQWGNSQAIRLDKATLAQSGLRNGSELVVNVRDDGSIILTPLRRVVRASGLDELFRGVSSLARCEELETGGPAGREMI